MRTPTEIAIEFYGSIERGEHGEVLRGHFMEDAVTTTYPNLTAPTGNERSMEESVAASTAGAGLLASQRYDVLWSTEVGATAILRLTWRGVIAADAGPFHAGQELVAHIAQFVETDAGRIRAIHTYDCYEPFSTQTRA